MRSTAPPLAVSTSALTKSFGGDAGVFNLDLEIDSGSIVGFVGPSGSGKTTTVRLMTGVTAPDSGTVEVLGQRPVAFSRETRARIGYMPQLAILYPDLTLRENLNFAASLYGMPYRRKERVNRLIDFVELEGAMDRLPREASGGEKRRVMLASTLIHRPDLIFLDEPTAGIDPVLRKKIWDRFSELGSDGRTLVVTTQYVGEAAYCDYVAVLANGRMLTFDTPDGLRRSAFGGEMMEVGFASPPGHDDISSFQGLAHSRNVDWIDSTRARLVVDDPEEATGVITRWAGERNIELTKAETYLPPFDDVFVELVSKLDPKTTVSNGS